MESRHFNMVDVIDARRRGNGEAQVFATNEALQEYTRRTGSHFPHGHPKAGLLLRLVLRRPRDSQKEYDKARDKDLPTSSSKKEARSRKKNRIVAEALETTNIYP